jgi:hypothetical protein
LNGPSKSNPASTIAYRVARHSINAHSSVSSPQLAPAKAIKATSPMSSTPGRCE